MDRRGSARQRVTGDRQLTVLAAALVPVGLAGDADRTAFAPFLLTGILTPASVGLFVALRRPGNRVAWILQLGALSLAVVMLASVIASSAGETTLGLWAVFVAFPTAVADAVTLTLLQVWPAVAVAVAITRHGLYSIDRLVNRTLVYAALSALLIATYALVLLGIGQLVGDSKLTASLATIAAALAFLPLRDRLQTVVDRRFARRRFDAVRLLRDFLDEVRDGRAEPEDVGAVIARALDDPGATLVFELPETGAHADRDGHAVELPDDGRRRSVIGRELGVLLHAPAAPDLLDGVLAAAAVPVELARLRVELRLQLAEVESSRARIAQAGYEERRRLERDLHDGAQQRLVTLGIVLRRLQRSLPREARMLVPALDAAVDEVAASIADLRTIAAGVRPPRLDEGLAAALADLARGAAIPVDVAATPDRAQLQ